MKAFFPPILAVFFILTSSVQAYRPIIDLGVGKPLSINSKGQIVGTANGQACIFDSTGGLSSVYLGGTVAYSINNNGQIVGNSGDVACLFDPTGGGNNRELGTLPNFSIYSGARSINNNGQIVGWAAKRNNYTHACLFDSTGNSNNVDLGTIDYYSSFATSINNNNQIVGYLSIYMGYDQAGLFDFNGSGVVTDLGESRANAINNKGQIVGIYGGACLFDPTGGGANISLGTLGGPRGEALSINDNGLIVGWALNAANYDRACLFDPTGNRKNIDLNTFINPSSGWILESANCINNNDWIVGTGWHNGYEHAFLLIPEPTTLLLLGFGGLSLLRKRKS